MMRKQVKAILIILVLAGLCSIGRMLETASAREAAASEKEGKELISGETVNLLFVLIDTNKDGKISKQEWMNFMGSAFDRLDQNKSGELDPKELAQLRFPQTTFASGGK